MKQYLLLGVLLLISGVAMAEDAPVVIIANGGSTCIAGVNGDVCHHIAEGKDITVRVDQPENGTCKALKAEVYQASARLEMPIGDDAVSQVEKGGCQHQEFSFTGPAVRGETEFFVRVLTRDAKGNWEGLKDIGVMVYPATLLDSVKNWAKNKQNALVVTDKDGDFAAFLDEQKIEYYTVSTTPRDTTVAEIIVDEPRENEKPEANTLYLEEKSKGIAALRVIDKDSRIIARAQMKLIAALKAGDPLAEKTFAELFGIITQ